MKYIRLEIAFWSMATLVACCCHGVAAEGSKGNDRMPLPRFESDFPGGNIELLDIDRETWTITMRPALRGKSPHRGWFYCKMKNIVPGRSYTLRVMENVWAGIYSYSEDGAQWRQFSKYHRQGALDYTLTQTFHSPDVFVAMMEPYLQSHLDRLIADVGTRSIVKTTDFWTSEAGRRGKLITIDDKTAPEPKYHVWITARMHAFEAVASWVADGMVRWVASDDAEAKQLRQKIVFHVIPIMDIDSVQIGSSGKHRTPIDFARGSCDRPHWNALKALLDKIHHSDSIDLYLDLHGPRGDQHDVFFYAQEDKRTTAAYERDFTVFRRLVGETLGDVLPYNGRCFRCPVGPDGRGQSYAGMSFFYLFEKYYGKSNLRLALGVETPWGGPNCSSKAFRQAGISYAKAINRFFADRKGVKKGVSDGLNLCQ